MDNRHQFAPGIRTPEIPFANLIFMYRTTVLTNYFNFSPFSNFNHNVAVVLTFLILCCDNTHPIRRLTFVFDCEPRKLKFTHAEAQVTVLKESKEVVWKNFLGVNAHLMWFSPTNYQKQITNLKLLGLEWVRLELQLGPIKDCTKSVHVRTPRPVSHAA